MDLLTKAQAIRREAEINVANGWTEHGGIDQRDLIALCDATEAWAKLLVMTHDSMGEYVELLEPEDGLFVVRNRYAGVAAEGATLKAAISALYEESEANDG